VKRNLLKYAPSTTTSSSSGGGGSQNLRERLRELWSDRTMFSEEFEALSRVRVRNFCEVYTGLRDAWKAIGFDV